MCTVATDTYQSIKADSVDGKRFLRKVVRGDFLCDQSWRVRATPDRNWCLRFERTIKGETGEPDVEVTVETDIQVRTPPDSKVGCEVKSFSDCEAVFVPRPRQMWTRDAKLIAWLVLEGATLSIVAKSGSVNSSTAGLAWLDLQATLPHLPYERLTIDSTVFQNGKCLCSGAVQD